MANILWSQDIFSKGELSPYMYARVTVNEYNNGLKTAQNVLTYPTGAAGKRFGTLYNATLTGFDTFDDIYFQTYQYLNECIYQLLFAPLAIYIYLEGMLVATKVTTLIGPQVYNLSSTVLGPNFEFTGAGFRPKFLSRSPDAANVISAASADVLTLTTPVTAGMVLPARFINVGGTLPTTDPQILIGVTYFVKFTSTTTATLFATANDAKFDNNQFSITNNGSGTNSLITQNTWTVADIAFKNVPAYDFNGGYDAVVFTKATVDGSVAVATTGPIVGLDASFIGGAFIGGGGTGRITAVADTSHFTLAMQIPFDSTANLFGANVYLAEPAWSDKRGWPQICSSYQNRSLFANTASLPNGFWASVVNDYTDFGDLTADDDDAISWLPSSNDINFIRFIVPYRSITVHTNSGIYSSPLSDVAAITPSNFTLQLQDSTPADVLQPQAIDNQVLVLSGDDAHRLLWDGINNAYTSDIVSVVSEQTIRSPVDETAFADLHRAGSRYVFIINANGSMAIFQTLISQNVSGFTPQIMEQSYGSAQFLQAASSSDGRCWFVVQRQLAVNAAPIAITAFTSSTLTAVASNLSTTDPIAITFTTAGTLPATTPALALLTYYWALGVDANTFKVYASQEDALADTNAFVFTSAGTSSNLVSWPLQTYFTLEELTQDVYLDCAIQYNGVPTDTVNTGGLFNAQMIKMVGDGFGFETVGANNEITFEAHGEPVEVSNAYIGYPINTIMEPLPLTISQGGSTKNTTLTRPSHIRTVNFMFNNTIGGTINGVPIAIKPFNQAQIGDPPFPARGVFEMSVMKAWDDFNNPTFTIEHNDPFNIELLGVFYSVDL